VDTNWEEIFWKITKDGRYLDGLKYGKPRTDHAEGSVMNHVMDLEKNLERMQVMLSPEEFWKLRIMVHVHDCMKFYAKRDAAIEDPASHASLAAKFLSEYVADVDLMNMIQYHDEGYALWKQQESRGKYSAPRFQKVVRLIWDVELYLLFTVLDGYTPSKEPERIRWYVLEVENEVGRGKLEKVFEAMKLFGV
jgi:hypothetical protein